MSIGCPAGAVTSTPENFQSHLRELRCLTSVPKWIVLPLICTPPFSRRIKQSLSFKSAL